MIQTQTIDISHVKKILENLKHQQGHPIFYQMVLSFISYHFDDIQLLHELSRIFYKLLIDHSYQFYGRYLRYLIFLVLSNPFNPMRYISSIYRKGN